MSTVATIDVKICFVFHRLMMLLWAWACWPGLCSSGRWRGVLVLQRAEYHRGQGAGLELKEERFRWDIGKKFFPVRVGRPWHRVPREAVAAPGSLAVSKARLEYLV